MGYYRAGFNVVGVDIEPQPRYPFKFLQVDALKILRFILATGSAYRAIHASPPCQAFTAATRVRDPSVHPDLIGPTRELLEQIGVPFVIENVVGAPLRNPALLCGAMFPELRVYRHRLFETSFDFTPPSHPDHTAPITKMGRPPQPGEFMHVVGNFSGVPAARKAMGIDWMVRNELKEAIPPAFTECVGTALKAHLRAVDRALAPSLAA